MADTSEITQQLFDALVSLLDTDPHDLNDSRPCQTCAAALKALDAAREVGFSPPNPEAFGVYRRRKRNAGVVK